MAILIGCIGTGRSTAAVNGTAAGGVGYQHTLAKKLRSQLYVGGLPTACTRARELKQGLKELAASYINR